MRIILLFPLLILATLSIKGQQISLEVGKNISSFEYSNSFGENLENLQSTNHTFMNLGYRRFIFTEKLFLNANALFNTYGATGSNIILDNYYEWISSYIGIGLGIEYEFIEAGNFIFSLKAGASAEFLIQGTQTINNQVFDLSSEDDFDSSIYVFRGGLNVQYKISEKLNLFTQYQYGTSGSFTDTTGDLTINTHNFGFGLLINISKNISNEISLDTFQMNELKLEMEKNSQKIKDLENDTAETDILKQKIAAKEVELLAIKESISEALQPYDGNQLTVKEIDGKVYITLDNDMLFKSGSWKINENGEETIAAIGEVLAENKDLSIQVEGHTDNKAFKENKMSNWDLSTKRASAIVEIFSQNENINPKNLTASGRGEFDPIADNETKEGRALNRRIEIIISPNLEEIAKIIHN